VKVTDEAVASGKVTMNDLQRLEVLHARRDLARHVDQRSIAAYTHTHTRSTALFPGPPGVSRYQKGNTNLDFTEARDSEWQWHQLGLLGHIQVCISLQTDNHASTPLLSFFTGRMPFLPPNQQHQSTEAR